MAKAIGISALGRFFQKVTTGSKEQCWFWTGFKDRDGYGSVTVDKKSTRSHRWIFEQFYGQIPVGWFVCHTCDNPSCVNPFHLFPGTHTDNVRDSISKGRFRGGGWVMASRDSCKKGHPFNEENTRIVRYGWGPYRQCIICAREA